MTYYPNNPNGQKTMANSAPVVVASDQSAVPISGTITANIGTSGSLALDATLTGGTARAKITDGTNNAAVKAASTAAVATDPALVVAVSPNNTVKVDGSAVTQPVSGTVTTSPPANASTNVAQFGGNAVATGTGASGVGVPRVTVANDSNVLATQSGTWTVQPGNTANTTPWLTQNTPGTSGGYSVYRLLSAATTNGNNIKASAGQVFGWYIANTSTSLKYVKLYNKAAAPTVGTDVPFMTIPVPANTTASGGAGTNVEFMNGIAFGTGISIAITGAVADADTTAVAANDVIVNLFYK